jgi:putative Mg2+ transporter-C (MgtC) family protein
VDAGAAVNTDLLDPVGRLVVAMLTGMALGLNRDLHGKPTGIRTLGLVAFSSALITIAMVRFLTPNSALDPGALSRGTQGLNQGVLTGIGFVGAGVILRAGATNRIRGLTTAATVWTTSIVGLVCGFGDWGLLGASIVLILLLLTFGGPLERWARLLLGGDEQKEDGS